MDAKFTRRRFLAAASAGAAYLALTNMVGSELLGRAPKVGRSRTPKVRALQTPLVSTLPNISSPPPDGLWTFRSRPDLSPPAVEVTKEARDTAPGYVFVAPEEDVAGQGGSMIVDDRGQVMWFRPLQGSHGRAMNLEVQSYRGEPVLTWIETVPGEYVIFDGSYREIARFGAANGYNRDHHEFLISPQDTALTTIYNTVPRDLSSLGGHRNGVEVQGIVQELDIETGEVLFEWHSLDHVGLDETYATLLQDGRPGLDYFHLNSIDVDHHDNLRASARKTSAVYLVDRKTGEVIWRLGGKGDGHAGTNPRPVRGGAGQTPFRTGTRYHRPGYALNVSGANYRHRSCAPRSLLLDSRLAEERAL